MKRHCRFPIDDEPRQRRYFLLGNYLRSATGRFRGMDLPGDGGRGPAWWLCNAAAFAACCLVALVIWVSAFAGVFFGF